MTKIEIEGFYDYGASKRYGLVVEEHKGIKSVLAEQKSNYELLLKDFAAYLPIFKAMSFDQGNELDPYWDNGFFSFLDIVALFGLLAKKRPRKYIEIGSGNSTKVAHFAKAKVGLDFEIISIDPNPRAEIDSICDSVIRKPLQDCDLNIFSKLKEGDILFFDGSHRVLQNSDNQVLFFEIIPRLNPGVLIHIHDIFWPYDYPNEWCNRYYSEQYVLGAMLLYSPDLFEIIFPGFYVTENCPYEDLFGEIWGRKGFENIHKHGNSFWFRKVKSNKALNLT